jgi:hypothetical protein
MVVAGVALAIVLAPSRETAIGVNRERVERIRAWHDTVVRLHEENHRLWHENWSHGHQQAIDTASTVILTGEVDRKIDRAELLAKLGDMDAYGEAIQEIYDIVQPVYAVYELVHGDERNGTEPLYDILPRWAALASPAMVDARNAVTEATAALETARTAEYEWSSEATLEFGASTAILEIARDYLNTAEAFMSVPDSRGNLNPAGAYRMALAAVEDAGTVDETIGYHLDDARRAWGEIETVRPMVEAARSSRGSGTATADAAARSDDADQLFAAALSQFGKGEFRKVAELAAAIDTILSAPDMP